MKLMKKPLNGSTPRTSTRKPRATMAVAEPDAGVGRDPGGSPPVTGRRPGHGVQHPPAVEGGGRQHVEHGQHHVDDRQPPEGGDGQAAAAGGLERAVRTTQSTAPNARLTSGPTPAIPSSAPGDRASPSMRVTPPIHDRVIPSTCIRKRPATTAWPSSWSSTPSSSTTAVRAPATAYAVPV